jgi:sugar O-acyltransferase (sialic acid O-acetyltransferase NeuD family)
MDLYIVGAGGHGRELHAYVSNLLAKGWNGCLRGYLDDGLAPGVYGRLNVLGPVAEFAAPTPSCYITAFGDNALRRRMVLKIESLFGEDSFSPWTLADPLAHAGEDVEVGAGTCLAPGSVVTARTSIGRHCILNVRSSVSHDCTIGDFVNINPAATICGWVNVGEGAYVGAGAVVKDRVTIGPWSIIGAGAVVVRDIPPNATAVGVPARVIKTRDVPA